MREKTYEELELTDDFMFGKIMQNKKLCKGMLERLLEITIDDITYPEQQKPIIITSEGKSVRLDVYVQSSNDVVYDAEMQQENKSREHQAELPKRSRYYQGMIDLNLLEKGMPYQELKESYVIFICTFDPFKANLPQYTFQNVCIERPDIILDDKATKVFFNTKGDMTGLSQEKKAFLEYLDKRKAEDLFTEEIDQEVKKARVNKTWRREYMKTLLHELEIREEAREEGRTEGLEEGARFGIELAKQVIRMDMEGISKEEIAKRLQITIEKVVEILK